MPPRHPTPPPGGTREFHPTETLELGPHTKVKAELSTIVSVGATLITAVIWAWNLYSDVQHMKDDMKGIKTDLAEIKKAVTPGIAKTTPHVAPRPVDSAAYGPPDPANP